MSESSRIYPSLEADAQSNDSLPDYHWQLCRQFMDRYQDRFSEEQLYALSHIFANTQLLLRGDADQAMLLVLDLVKDQPPVGTEDVASVDVDHVEKCCWEREAEPEFLESSPVDELESCNVAKPEMIVDDDVPPLNDKKASRPTAEVPKATVPEPLIESIPKPEQQILPKVAPPPFKIIRKSLVLFDNNFYKTQTYFNRLGCGQLEVVVKPDSNCCVTRATISLNHLIIVQVSAQNGQAAMKMAIDQFFRVTEDYFFKVQTLLHKNALQRRTNLVQRQTRAATSEDPLVSIDPAHYQKLMRDFLERDNGYHLVFSKDFTNLECSTLQGIAAQLKLNGRVYDLPDGSKRFLVLARELPPHEIVRRIILEQDTDLGLQYSVCPPKRNGRAMWHALSCKVSKTVRNSANAVTAYDPELLSPKEDPPVSSSLNSLQQKPAQCFMKKVKTVTGSYAETLANLSVFKPVSPVRCVDDVYRNLVLIGRDFSKTAEEFAKLKVGSLRLSSKALKGGGFRASVQVGKFVLVQVRNHKGIRHVVRNNAYAAFFKKAKMFCYQITKKQSPKLEIHVAKEEDPSTNIGHYKRLITKFWKYSAEQELVFSAEFTKADRQKLHSIARALNLASCNDGEEGVNRQLRIFGRRLPALAIVERVVVAKDPKLSTLFKVTPPRVGLRRTGKGGS